ncbi:MAG: COG1361 S-layer family protein [Nanoarchaeota archaeon]|nr:COG1361 S-layer family protein [Nanoarchaeota archaeon]
MKSKITFIGSLIRSFSLVMAVLLCLSFSFAATGLNVVLANQNPDPVQPGNTVTLNVKVANSGSQAITDAIISFVPNNNFKLVEGEEKTRDLGLIPAFSTLEGSQSYVIAKYRLRVSDTAPLGVSPVQFKIETSSGVTFPEFDVSIEDANPVIEVSDFSVNVLEAGQSGTLTMKITNANSIDLSNVVVALDLESVSDEVLSLEKGTNRKVFPFLGAGQSVEVPFALFVNPDAEAKSYLLPFTVEYEDSLGNSFTKEMVGSVSLFSEPELSVRLDSQEVFTTGKGKVSFAVANPGTSTIKGVQIEIVSGADYEVLDGEFHYVGDLNPDDFQSVQNEIYIKNQDASFVTVKVKYSDSYNNEREETLQLPLKVYSDEQLAQYGLSGSSSSFSFVSLLVPLLVGIVAFFVGRSRGYRKARAKK